MHCVLFAHHIHVRSSLNILIESESSFVYVEDSFSGKKDTNRSTVEIKGLSLVVIM